MNRLCDVCVAVALVCLTSIAALAAEPTMVPGGGYPEFALGADVSWTPYIEYNSLHRYYRNGGVDASHLTTIPGMLADNGVDAVRLRVWVNPKEPIVMTGFGYKAWGSSHHQMSTYGTCTVDEMTALALRLARQGHRLMVVLQLSDTWADPGSQFVPRSWEGCASVEELTAKAVGYVTEVLMRLRDLNVNVEWVQIGNETNTGMLKWALPSDYNQTVESLPYGCEIAEDSSGAPSQTTKHFVQVFSALAATAKSVYPQVKTVLHLANADNWGSINWTLGLLKRAGLTPEVCNYVGLSLYPGINDGKGDYTAMWQQYADAALQTIAAVHSDYGYRTLLCEVGMNNEYSLSADTEDVPKAMLQQCYIDQCNTDVEAFTNYLIANLATPTSTCDGLFYWEPETDYMQNYPKGACVSATPGMGWERYKATPNAWWRTIKEHSEFPRGGLVEFAIDNDGVGEATADSSASEEYYTLQGVKVERPGSGLYIVRRGLQTYKLIKP